MGIVAFSSGRHQENMFGASSKNKWYLGNTNGNPVINKENPEILGDATSRYFTDTRL
jgi:hypothetical protein